MNLPLLTEISKDLCLKGYSIQDNALAPSFIEALAHDFEIKLQAKEFAPARIGRGSNPHLNESIRSDWICWNANTSLWSTFVQELTDFFNRELFIGANESEFHYAYYDPLGHYDFHYDEDPSSKSHSKRLLTLLLYFNKNWSPVHGGCLEIESVGSFAPEWNRMIVFESAQFMHRVTPANAPRRSLTGWLKHRTF
jgi:SM-20-related protein